ncbi:hypothetical protein RFI_38007, partial [Reticulomyxa filosa]
SQKKKICPFFKKYFSLKFILFLLMKTKIMSMFFKFFKISSTNLKKKKYLLFGFQCYNIDKTRPLIAEGIEIDKHKDTIFVFFIDEEKLGSI